MYPIGYTEGLVEEIARTDLEGGGDLMQEQNGTIPNAALDAANVRAADFGAVRQFFLRKALRLVAFPQILHALTQALQGGVLRRLASASWHSEMLASCA